MNMEAENNINEERHEQQQQQQEEEENVRNAPISSENHAIVSNHTDEDGEGDPIMFQPGSSDEAAVTSSLAPTLLTTSRMMEKEERARINGDGDGVTPFVAYHPHDDDDDDDTDNWSRLVETDEIHPSITGEGSFRMESVLEQEQQEQQQQQLQQNSNSNSDSCSTSAQHENEPQQQPLAVPRPRQPKLTMKEKLVLRERERRIETKRARLKRQFALSNNNNNNNSDDQHGSIGEEQDEGESDDGAADDSITGGYGATESVATLGEESTMVHLDEEEEAESAEQARLPVTMERFLRNSDSFNPQLETTSEENNHHHPSNNNSSSNNHATDNNNSAGGVLMERFLNDPVVAPPVALVDPNITTTPNNLERPDDMMVGGEQQRTVSFDVVDMNSAAPNDPNSTLLRAEEDERDDDGGRSAALNRMVSASTSRGDFSVDANASLQGHVDDETSVAEELLEERVAEAASDDTPLMLHGVGTSSAVSVDEPRVLTLTEADMQEMVATEVESIANYPPSERDDNLSEVGELADFPILHHHHSAQGIRGDVSQDTPTTVMDSASLISGGHGSEKAVSSDRQSVAEDGGASVNNDLIVMTQPREETDLLSPTTTATATLLEQHPGGPELVHSNPIHITTTTTTGMADDDDGDLQPPTRMVPEVQMGNGINNNDNQQQQEVESIIVNRRIRPGMVGNMPTTSRTTTRITTATSPNRPNETTTPEGVAAGGAADAIVDDFDYDKHDHDHKLSASTTAFHDNDSFHNLPDDDDHHDGQEMHLSPLILPLSSSSSKHKNTNIVDRIQNAVQRLPLHYGTTTDEGPQYHHHQNTAVATKQTIAATDPQQSNQNESAPLLGGVPPEIITRSRNATGLEEPQLKHHHQQQEEDHRHSFSFRTLGPSLRSRLNSVFSDVRSEEEEEKVQVWNESDAYNQSSIWARAVPERLFALTITLLLEIPVLFMISGGSDALCELVGRKRYQLLLSFLPLTSAISGNVGLQASTLTTRAISHAHVTEQDFGTWLGKELGAAVYLGLGMGSLLGLIAFVASGMDLAFGITLFVAQWLSIVTAGFTGTLAPLLFRFIFQRDAGKWGGPLETAIQDIVGSFAMVVLSYHLLSWFGSGGPMIMDPRDQCGGGSGGSGVSSTSPEL